MHVTFARIANHYSQRTPAIARLLAIERHCPGLPEAGRWREVP